MAIKWTQYSESQLMPFGRSFSRSKGQPLDESSVIYGDTFDQALANAKEYAAGDSAYVGQYLSVTCPTGTRMYAIVDESGTLVELPLVKRFEGTYNSQANEVSVAWPEDSDFWTLLAEPFSAGYTICIDLIDELDDTYRYDLKYRDDSDYLHFICTMGDSHRYLVMGDDMCPSHYIKDHSQIPTFDLVARGLPSISSGISHMEMYCEDIIAALQTGGPVRLYVNFDTGPEYRVFNFERSWTSQSIQSVRCICVEASSTYTITFESDNSIHAYHTVLAPRYMLELYPRTFQVFRTIDDGVPIVTTDDDIDWEWIRDSFTPSMLMCIPPNSTGGAVEVYMMHEKRNDYALFHQVTTGDIIREIRINSDLSMEYSEAAAGADGPQCTSLEDGSGDNGVQQLGCASLGSQSWAIGNQTHSGITGYRIEHITIPDEEDVVYIVIDDTDLPDDQKVSAMYGASAVEDGYSRIVHVIAPPDMAGGYALHSFNALYIEDIGSATDLDETLSGTVITCRRLKFLGYNIYIELDDPEIITSGYCWVTAAELLGDSVDWASVYLLPGAQALDDAGAGFAEGYMTKVYGTGGHAEGVSTQSYGLGGHAEGWHTTTSASAGHAEGAFTSVTGLAGHAEGAYTVASGEGDHAEGIYTTASGNYSHAEGESTTASGANSHAEGSGSTAAGYIAHAEGSNTTASGTAAHAEGLYCHAEGSDSHAEGSFSHAKGGYSHAEGNRTTAEGSGSHAEGNWSHTPGMYSHAEGSYTQATISCQHVQGKYNLADDSESPELSNAFIIGNGSSSSRGNAFSVDWKGNVVSLQAVQSETGADYAEYFEWEDQNVNNEDRVGIIVTLVSDKIQPANAGDDVLGVVSGTAGVVGDTAAWEWANKYAVDEFGRIIWDMVEEFAEVPVLGKDGNLVRGEDGEVVKEQKSVGFFPHRRLNPEYDETQVYIPRSQRKEWACIGMMGKLHVRDDGTCTPGRYMTVKAGGIGTLSDSRTNMRVLKRISEDVVLVVLK